MKTGLTREQQAALCATPGAIVGKSIAESLLGEKPPEPPECSEAEFQARVIAEAEARGWLVYHTHDSRRSKAGFLDLCMVRRPALGPDWSRHARVIFAELKSENGKEMKEQREWRLALEEIALPGVLGVAIEVYLWRPGDWNRILEILR